MPKQHKVRRGECIASIAGKYGFLPETLWEDPANRKLQELRKDPDILAPGDIVIIPERRSKEVSVATETRQSFRIKRPRVMLRLRIFEEPVDSVPQQGGVTVDTEAEEVEMEDPDDQAIEDIPSANKPYVLEVDGKLSSGETDGEGMLEAKIPHDAQKARLILEPGTKYERELVIKLGQLDPIEEWSGVKQRLANLGFDCGDRSNRKSADLIMALKVFQKKYGLQETGEADSATIDKLFEIHGS